MVNGPPHFQRAVSSFAGCKVKAVSQDRLLVSQHQLKCRAVGTSGAGAEGGGGTGGSKLQGKSKNKPRYRPPVAHRAGTHIHIFKMHLLRRKGHRRYVLPVLPVLRHGVVVRGLQKVDVGQPRPLALGLLCLLGHAVDSWHASVASEHVIKRFPKSPCCVEV